MTAFDSAEGTQAAVLECFRTVFPFMSDDEIVAARRGAVPEWDSLATLSLITLLEETLEIMLTDDDVEQLNSLEDAQAVVARRHGASA